MNVMFTNEVFVGARTYANGDTANLPDAVANALIKSGDAVAKQADELERADLLDEPLETATADTKAKPKPAAK